MGLKIRIETKDGKFISNVSPIEEMLTVLADKELKLATLTVDEEDTLRGWLLLKAQEMQQAKLLKIIWARIFQ